MCFLSLHKKIEFMSKFRQKQPFLKRDNRIKWQSAYRKIADII
jgi:hypothetical protein